MTTLDAERAIFSFEVADPSTAAPARVLNTPEAKRLGELDLMQVTLDQLTDALASLNEFVAAGIDSEKKSATVRTLFDGIVVNYCRCFDPTRRNSTLDAAVVFAGKPKGIVAHEQMMTQRSKHIAHDVNGHRDVRIGFITNEDGTEFALERRKLRMEPDANIIRNMGRLLRDATKYVHDEQFRLEGIAALQIAAMSPDERLAAPAMEFADATKINLKAARPR